MSTPLRRAVPLLAAVLLLLPFAAGAQDAPPAPAPTVAVDADPLAVPLDLGLDEAVGLCPVEPLEMAFTLPSVPNYCDDCKPCSERWECGIQGGYYMGYCSPNPGYCGRPGYSACVCL